MLADLREPDLLGQVPSVARSHGILQGVEEAQDLSLLLFTERIVGARRAAGLVAVASNCFLLGEGEPQRPERGRADLVRRRGNSGRKGMPSFGPMSCTRKSL